MRIIYFSAERNEQPIIRAAKKVTAELHHRGAEVLSLGRGQRDQGSGHQSRSHDDCQTDFDQIEEIAEDLGE